ncbi:hypothetical protein EWM64_g189 [Hericium alpestre]|uniref:Golgi apparatus membrane protein TVP38 n=1 Tax=Hericium alpestre TaxID=135208 RepID=A0A4Z0AD47_9AGAM|nr:hypothetical protein EWM64_g189 [Hericium alpestre]
MALFERMSSFYHNQFKHFARRVQKLPVFCKLVLSAVLLFYISLIVLAIVFRPARIAQFLYDLAQRISSHPAGWILLVLMITAVSCPPMIGHTFMLEICGFAYGIRGFWVAAAGSLFGSAFVLVVLRYMFSERVREWSSKNKRWQALETVINAKGLPLIVLIRWSSFPPWPYSNMLFSSIQAVSLFQFMLATICIFPRFLLYVFVGSRLASLSDGKQRHEMDTQTKVINSLFVVGGLSIGVLAGYIVYTLMEREMRGVSPEVEQLAEEAIEEADEGAPLLDNFSSDSVRV